MKTKTITIKTEIKTVEMCYSKYIGTQIIFMLLGTVNMISLSMLFTATMINAIYLAIDFILYEDWSETKKEVKQ